MLILFAICCLLFYTIAYIWLNLSIILEKGSTRRYEEKKFVTSLLFKRNKFIVSKLWVIMLNNCDFNIDPNNCSLFHP